jgi:aspartate aminotransferase-like enzyme
MSPMFVPGPVDVDPDVLAAQTAPMLPHRSQEFEAIFRRASENSRQIFFTQAPVFIVTASGTGLQEAAVRNLAKRDVLSCVNGAFSKRWYDVALSNGKQADILEAEWGQPILPDMVSRALQAKRYELLTLVHNETSAGVQNPIQEIAAAARAVSPDTLICIDAVSSLGGVRLEMDAWGLDMVLTSSQKCLALPAGLALAAVSERAMEYARQVPLRGWYFDLVRMEEHRLKDSTPATPAMSLIYALDYKLQLILEEGLEQRFARHKVLAERVQNWGESCGLHMFAAPGYRSLTVTTFSSPPGFHLGNLNQFLLQRGMRIANGYGLLKDKTFRVAHMGDTRVEDIEVLLSAMEIYLNGSAIHEEN